MGTTAVRSNAATAVATVDMKVEVLVIAVSDVERAKEFYSKLGWRLDQTPPGIVQFTPHGSWCSVQFGTKLTSAAPGSSKGFLIVSDIGAAREALVAAGIEVGEIFHLGPDGPVSGPDPEHRSYRSRAVFSDPDGNVWLLQEITSRLPGRFAAGPISFSSASDFGERAAAGGGRARRAREAHWGG